MYLRSLPPSSRQRAARARLPLPLAFPRRRLEVAVLHARARSRRMPARARSSIAARYLVRALGHCGECHTPRNFLGGPKKDRFLAGAKDVAPNLTPTRLKKWGDGELRNFLTTGHHRRRRRPRGGDGRGDHQYHQPAHPAGPGRHDRLPALACRHCRKREIAWNSRNTRSRSLVPSMNEAQRLVELIPRLRRYARALVGDRATADDLVQDTLERAWAKLHLYRRGTDLRAWLFTVMHNVHVNRVRAARATDPLERRDARARAARAAGRRAAGARPRPRASRACRRSSARCCCSSRSRK